MRRLTVITFAVVGLTVAALTAGCGATEYGRLAVGMYGLHPANPRAPNSGCYETKCPFSGSLKVTNDGRYVATVNILRGKLGIIRLSVGRYVIHGPHDASCAAERAQVKANKTVAVAVTCRPVMW